MARLSIATVKICATLKQLPSLPGWAPVGGSCAHRSALGELGMLKAQVDPSNGRTHNL